MKRSCAFTMIRRIYQLSTQHWRLRLSVRAGLVNLLLACVGVCVEGAAFDEAPKGEIRILPVEREKPQAATVRLSNGLILSGMCSSATTLAPVPASRRVVDKVDQKLSMRLIHQGSREVYVPARRAEEPVLDVNAWPSLSFRIPQKRQRRENRPPILPLLGPFDEHGICTATVIRPGGETEPLKAGIVSINELYAEVQSLTHDWEFPVSLEAIPREKLVSLLTHAEDYGTNSTRRLEIIRMLIRANRLPEAAQMLQMLTQDFPELAGIRDQQLQVVREQTAAEITLALERRRDAGQHRLASNGARLYPGSNLTPETLVRVERLVRDYDALNQRMDRIRHSLAALSAELPDELQRKDVQRCVQIALAGLDEDSVTRFSAFELMLEAPAVERPVADEQIATALSGWLLGPENTLSNLLDVLFLFETRENVLEYLATEPDEVTAREQLALSISKTEGVSAERLAALIRLLPTVNPLATETPASESAAVFRLEASGESAGAVGLLPPEYRQTRSWPVVIAFPGQQGDPDVWLRWWAAQAENYGYIVVIPQFLPEDGTSTQGYAASAQQHRQFLQLLRTLRLRLKVDDDHIFVAGHGVGAEMAIDMMTSHPHEFAGVAALSTTGRRHFQWTATNAIEKPWYVVMGDAHPLWFDKMGLLTAKLFRRGEEIKSWFDVMFVKYPDRGAESFPEEADDIFQWMARYERRKFHEHIHARLLRSTDLDWGWIQLDSLPPQFAALDPPTTPDQDAFRPATLNARLGDRNVIVVESAPADFSILLAPDLPGIDFSKPIRIVKGRIDKRIDYQPSVMDMLEQLYRTGDRSRLCYMRVDRDDL